MDVIVPIISANKVHNNCVVAGALPTGNYSHIRQGINQQIPYSGEVMVVPSGFYTVPDDGPLANRFRDPQATKVRFY